MRLARINAGLCCVYAATATLAPGWVSYPLPIWLAWTFVAMAVWWFFTAALPEGWP